MRAPEILALLVAGLLLLVACGGDGDGPSSGRAYELDGFCEVADVEPLDDAAATPAGPTVAELFAPAEGEHAATLAYDAGGTTGLTVRVALDDAPALRVVFEPDPGFEVGGCEFEEVQRKATVSYVTADGSFVESFATVLRARDRSVRTNGEVEADRLKGTASPPAEVADADRIVFTFDAEFGPDGISGGIGAWGETVRRDLVEIRGTGIGSFAAATAD